MKEAVYELLLAELDEDLKPHFNGSQGNLDAVILIQQLRQQAAQVRVLQWFSENGIGTWEYCG